MTFSAQVGPHEQNTSPEMTVVLGVCNSDGSVKQAIKTYTIAGTTRVWFSEASATMEGYALGSGRRQYYYIQITNAGNWWIDEMQLEANTTTGAPENFVRTSGSLVSNQSETVMLTNRKVCPNCSEYILSKSERFGRTDESPVDEPVETWAQEI
jgi:hypothetical protein